MAEKNDEWGIGKGYNRILKRDKTDSDKNSSLSGSNELSNALKKAISLIEKDIQKAKQIDENDREKLKQIANFFDEKSIRNRKLEEYYKRITAYDKLEADEKEENEELLWQSRLSDPEVCNPKDNESYFLEEPPSDTTFENFNGKKDYHSEETEPDDSDDYDAENWEDSYYNLIDRVEEQARQAEINDYDEEEPEYGGDDDWVLNKDVKYEKLILKEPPNKRPESKSKN